MHKDPEICSYLEGTITNFKHYIFGVHFPWSLFLVSHGLSQLFLIKSWLVSAILHLILVCLCFSWFNLGLSWLFSVCLGYSWFNLCLSWLFSVCLGYSWFNHGLPWLFLVCLSYSWFNLGLIVDCPSYSGLLLV